MSTAAILKEINKLPLSEKLLVVEKALKSIRLERTHSLEVGVAALYEDYKTDKELTAFTVLDTENFYEAR